MNVSQVKLANFEKMVLREAEKKRDEIIAQVKKEKDENIARIKAEIDRETTLNIEKTTKALAKEKNERLVHKQLLVKQRLLTEREKLIDSLFERISIRLREFVLSAEYEKYLFDSLKYCNEKLPSAKEIVISKQDEKYQNAIEKLGYTVSYTNEDIIGGLILTDLEKGIRIDDTILSKLSTAREKFLETYNLKI